jgi:hypothetical protein
MTTFGDQVYQYGGVPVSSGGAGRLMQMFESDNIWFVDGDNGLTGNLGNTPNQALTLISAAVSEASAGGTIYVKPKFSSDSEVSFYSDSIDIPMTKPGLSIIGAGNTWGNPAHGGGVNVIVSTAGVADHLVDVKAAGVLLENIRWTRAGGTATSYKSIVQASAGTTSWPQGLTIRGCQFEWDIDHPGWSLGVPNAAVGLGKCWVALIENCHFLNCLGGIVSMPVAGDNAMVHIMNNIFSGNPGNRDVDLMINNGSAGGFDHVIHGNIFGDGLPAHAGGAITRFIDFPYQTAGTGIFSNNYFACISGEQNFKEGGSQGDIADNYFMAGNWCRGTGNTAPYGIITDA